MGPGPGRRGRLVGGRAGQPRVLLRGLDRAGGTDGRAARSGRGARGHHRPRAAGPLHLELAGVAEEQVHDPPWPTTPHRSPTTPRRVGLALPRPGLVLERWAPTVPPSGCTSSPRRRPARRARCSGSGSPGCSASTPPPATGAGLRRTPRWASWRPRPLRRVNERLPASTPPAPGACGSALPRRRAAGAAPRGALLARRRPGGRRPRPGRAGRRAAAQRAGTTWWATWTCCACRRTSHRAGTPTRSPTAEVADVAVDLVADPDGRPSGDRAAPAAPADRGPRRRAVAAVPPAAGPAGHLTGCDYCSCASRRALRA